MMTSGNALPGGGQDVVGRVCGERVAIRMLEQLLIAADLLVAGEVSPNGKLGFGWSGRRHDAGWFVGRLRHAAILARTGCKQKGPGKPGAFDICELKTAQRE